MRILRVRPNIDLCARDSVPLPPNSSRHSLNPKASSAQLSVPRAHPISGRMLLHLHIAPVFCHDITLYGPNLVRNPETILTPCKRDKSRVLYASDAPVLIKCARTNSPAQDTVFNHSPLFSSAPYVPQSEAVDCPWHILLRPRFRN